jgi:hypothetical protein
MERREEVVVVHVIRHRRKNLQVTEPAEESPEYNVEFTVCEPVDMSMHHLREEKGGKGLRRVLMACPHILYPASEWNHIMLQLSSVLRIWLAYGIEFHRLREDVEVAMHDLRRHADDCTTRHDVAVECGTRFWDESGEAPDHAEGETESFFYTGGLE